MDMKDNDDFAQIQSNLPKANHFFSNLAQLYPNFASILPKSFQICPNLSNFAKKECLLGNAAASEGCSCIHCFYDIVQPHPLARFLGQNCCVLGNLVTFRRNLEKN